MRNRTLDEIYSIFQSNLQYPVGVAIEHKAKIYWYTFEM